MMQLLLVRHAETPSNVGGLLDSGTPGPELTALGRRQAEAVVPALRGRSVSSIHASTMIRTQQTAAPLALDRGIEPAIDDDFKEIEAGDLEMRSDRASVLRYLGVVRRWAAGDLDARMAGAQDGHEFFARFDAGIARAVASGGELPVVFSHGASIRVWAGLRCGGRGPVFAEQDELRNTGSVLVEQVEHAWRVVRWHSDPIGGAALTGSGGLDPTGRAPDAGPAA